MAAQKSQSRLLTSYIVGFVMSIILTISAYLLAQHHETLSRGVVIGSITLLALVQFVAQLIFFLHVGTGPKTRLKLIALITMIVVVGILVVGSLWIMYNLNQHMSTEQIN